MDRYCRTDFYQILLNKQTCKGTIIKPKPILNHDIKEFV